MSFCTINPFNNKKIAEFKFDSNNTIDEKIKISHEAFLGWTNLNVENRIEYVEKIIDGLDSKKLELANICTKEMGKPIKQSIAEIEKCILMAKYYCENSSNFLRPEMIKTKFSKSYIAYKGQGVILGIMPWNFPYWQVLRFAIPTMLAGNTVLIKHAPNVQASQKLLQEVFDNCDFPPSVFSTVIADIDQIKNIAKNDYIRGISFTGSEKAGRSVGELAGKNLKKCVLELGGSDPYLVLSDADINLAAKSCADSRFINNGQSCVAAKRWIVSKDIKEKFTELVSENINNLKMGNPLAEDIQIGPMARKDLKDELALQVENSLSLGAKVLVGGPSENNPNDCFYPPTLLDNVKEGQPAFDEELFGPVATIITANNDEHAIELANKSRYGLGGAVFSRNIEKAEEIARDKIDTGGVYINDFYKSVPELPFGGVKASGIGRELSKNALFEFVNIKTIVIA